MVPLTEGVHHLQDDELWVVPWHGVQLVPSGTWWVSWFWDDPAGRWCGADVCTPAEQMETCWKYVDLELDIVGDLGGFHSVVDEEEFLEAVRRGFISAEETASARSCEAFLETAMRERQEPFGTTAWRKLDQAIGMALPPTT